jgi:CheY-like chemotaxis protein
MSKVILVADDSTTMQKVAEITFKATEYTYVGARSADEAVEKAKAQKPALVLADAVMQGKSGYDLCQALKSEGKTADVPVIILCGNSAAFDPGKGAQVGADGSLSKPWDTQVMLEKVAEFIEKAASGVARPGAAAASAPIAAAPAAAPAAAAAAKPAAPLAVAAAAAAKQAEKPAPPRSATIMGMPTIKFPAGGGAPEVTVKVPDQVAPITVSPAPAAAPGLKPPAQPKPGSTTSSGLGGVATAPAASAPAASTGNGGIGRAPLVSGVPTKRSALVERTLAKMAARLAEASGLAPGSPELLALLKLSTEVVERVVWEVVPELAEQIIRENLRELTTRKGN